ncbi:MAG: MYXO-CTERM sorting domain-containing protein [Isosphaeraceae bacterium]
MEPPAVEKHSGCSATAGGPWGAAVLLLLAATGFFRRGRRRV